MFGVDNTLKIINVHTKENKSIHIAIADDHPLILEGLQLLLNKQPNFKVVGLASNGVELFEIVDF